MDQAGRAQCQLLAMFRSCLRNVRFASLPGVSKVRFDFLWPCRGLGMRRLFKCAGAIQNIASIPGASRDKGCMPCWYDTGVAFLQGKVVCQGEAFHSSAVGSGGGILLASAGPCSLPLSRRDWRPFRAPGLSL